MEASEEGMDACLFVEVLKGSWLWFPPVDRVHLAMELKWWSLGISRKIHWVHVRLIYVIPWVDIEIFIRQLIDEWGQIIHTSQIYQYLVVEPPSSLLPP